MLRFSEKDVLFITINTISFLSFAMYLFLDFIAVMAQVMASADSQYANIEVGFAMIRVAAYCMIVGIGMITALCDCWFVYRCIKKWRAEYWRDNL